MKYSSWTIILVSVIVLYLVSWMDMIPADATVYGLQIAYLPMSALWAFIIMDLTGFFKRERAKINSAAESSQPASRQEEFKRKMEEGRKAGYQPEEDVTVRIWDADTNTESSILIQANGKISVKGDVPQNIVSAALRLQEGIPQFGTVAVAAELQKQIFEMYGADDDS